MKSEIPRGVEVLVKKAAVDPAFKKTLLEKRAGAAAEIALGLSPAEGEILNAVPEAQLEAIIASTKVSPKLRPAFLGYAAAAMLATLASTATARGTEEWEFRTTGIDPDIPPKNYDYNINDPDNVDVPEDAGVIYGRVHDQFDEPVANVLVEIDATGLATLTNRHGFYVLTPVPAGVYNLTIQGKGFETERRSKVEVKTGYKTQITVRLFEPLEFEDRLLKEQTITGIRPDPPPKEGD